MAAQDSAAPAVWKLNNLDQIGGHAPQVLGAPRIVDGAAVFDGTHDGLILPVSPLAGLKEFTVEILFSPAADGSEAQRFFHSEDATGWCALIEIRVDGKGSWWLDTFLGATQGGTAMIDPKRLHPAGKWYWAALRFDGRKMTHFVNGVQELESNATWGPMGEGRTSLGVRLNQVYWFKGAIRELRVTPVPLAADKLQRVD